VRELRYPPGAVAGDLLRAVLGVVSCGVVLLAASPIAWLAAALVMGCIVFASFGVRAALRLRHGFELGHDGLRISHLATCMPWRELRKLKLGYFSTRRDHRDGWLELRLHFAGGPVRVDSRLDGFGALLGAALSAARAGELELDPATQRNLEWLGLHEQRDLAGGSAARVVPDA